MTKLMQAIHEDPEAVFEISADLPSGNKMIGTVGPMIGPRICANVGFEQNPTSPEDVAMAKQIMDQMMGMAPAVSLVTDSAQGRKDAHAEMRKFLGGGLG